MSAAHQAMEHTEHIQHAGHHDGHGGEHGDAKSRLGTYVGITMALLGVLLAFCAAKVGGERTELVQTLIERSNAQQQYHAQDVKHRIAFLALQQLHASVIANPTAAGIDRGDVLAMANTVDRYLAESHAAREWSESYEPAVEAHVEGQENYEWGQLLAEIGIVVASVALLIRQRVAWFVALALGFGSVAIVARTWVHISGVMAGAEHRIEHLGEEYRAMRARDSATAAESALLASMRAWAGAPAAAAHEPPAGAHEPAAAPEAEHH